ncbi:hypothetical protein MM236_17020 [Belliella sp. DSM 107340]|uniref:Uncharacterized protein n=1 Tax=Belliella calami TaxID=2923436 RepID=A0ABS9USV5_9BACT|nr:hypothetical protein [Belliella calami]MCH7399701.1 hypothetical protein [Belliella calami]
MKINVKVQSGKLFINDTEIEFPVHRQKLEAIFGKPSRLYYNINWKCVWDHLGIYTDYGVWDKIYRIHFLQKPYPIEKENASRSFFEGTLSIDDKQITTEKVEQITWKKMVFRQFKYAETFEPFGFCFEFNYQYRKEIPADKYLIKTTEQPIVAFQDFKFKLLVIDELMYKQQILKPKFDLYEFAEWYKKRSIDIEEEGYEEIAEVTDFFERLPITTDQAAKVENLYQDAGNLIYGEIQRFWTGEDDQYDIINLADALQFPNLKKLTIFKAIEQEEKQQESINLLRENGIDVQFF